VAKLAADRWSSLAAEFELTPAELAMRFALSLPAPLVIGMETVDQVKRNAAMLNLKPLSSAEVSQIHAAMAPWLSEVILNPARWQDLA
jgi:aryl-alcohol dehydrogenase-like predicted oxidoreductase